MQHGRALIRVGVPVTNDEHDAEMNLIAGHQFKVSRERDRRDHRIDATDALSSAFERSVHPSRKHRCVGGERQYFHGLDVREKPIEVGFALQALEALDDLEHAQDGDRELTVLR
jgi:hypothetical protein